MCYLSFSQETRSNLILNMNSQEKLPVAKEIQLTREELISIEFDAFKAGMSAGERMLIVALRKARRINGKKESEGEKKKKKWKFSV